MYLGDAVVIPSSIHPKTINEGTALRFNPKTGYLIVTPPPDEPFEVAYSVLAFSRVQEYRKKDTLLIRTGETVNYVPYVVQRDLFPFGGGLMWGHREEDGRCA